MVLKFFYRIHLMWKKLCRHRGYLLKFYMMTFNVSYLVLINFIYCWPFPQFMLSFHPCSLHHIFLPFFSIIIFIFASVMFAYEFLVIKIGPAICFDMSYCLFIFYYNHALCLCSQPRVTFYLGVMVI